MKKSSLCCSNGNEPTKSVDIPPDQSPTVQNPATSVHIHITRKMLILMAALLICPGLIVTAASSCWRVSHPTEDKQKYYSSLDPLPSQAVEGNPGPWGQLVYLHIMIDIPDEFMLVPSDNALQFAGFSRIITRSK